MITPLAPPTCGTFDLACAAGQAVLAAYQRLITEIARAAADLVVTTSTWWVTTDSVNPLDPAVTSAQNVIRPLSVLILVGSVLVQAIRMIVSHKGEPLMMVMTGLIRYAVVCAIGLVVLQAALQAGDALSVQLLGAAADNFSSVMARVLTEADATFLVLLLSVIAMLLALVQWVLMAMRQAGLLVLAAMLPLAASGSLTRSTRGWLDRLLSWLVAIVVYKPAAAFIYYIGFSYLSSPGTSDDGETATMITGVMVLLLAVIAMPVLMKFFSWSGVQIAGEGGSSGFLGAAGAATMARPPGRSGVIDRAASIEQTGPGSQHLVGTYAAAGPSGAQSAAGAGSAGAAVAAAATVSTTARSAGAQLTGGAEEDPR